MLSKCLLEKQYNSLRVFQAILFQPIELLVGSKLALFCWEIAQQPVDSRGPKQVEHTFILARSRVLLFIESRYICHM